MNSVEGARSMSRHRPADATEPAAVGGNVAATCIQGSIPGISIQPF